MPARKKLTKEEATEELKKYPTHFLEYYKTAATKPVTLTFKGSEKRPARPQAFQLRKRLHIFRSILQMAEHPLYPSAAIVKISLKQDFTEDGNSDVWLLVAENRDQEFDGLFKEAGIDTSKPQPSADGEPDFEDDMFGESDE